MVIMGEIKIIHIYFHKLFLHIECQQISNTSLGIWETYKPTHICLVRNLYMCLKALIAQHLICNCVLYYNKNAPGSDSSTWKPNTKRESHLSLSVLISSNNQHFEDICTCKLMCRHLTKLSSMKLFWRKSFCPKTCTFTPLCFSAGWVRIALFVVVNSRLRTGMR